ncbi:MAG: hypothetical protein KDK27_19030, partial [Leptospiraceae bacterium]|nr:hypothetical protein [Leptospiraceae bacterium]
MSNGENQKSTWLAVILYGCLTLPTGLNFHRLLAGPDTKAGSDVTAGSESRSMPVPARHHSVAIEKSSLEMEARESPPL